MDTPRSRKMREIYEEMEKERRINRHENIVDYLEKLAEGNLIDDHICKFYFASFASIEKDKLSIEVMAYFKRLLFKRRSKLVGKIAHTRLATRSRLHLLEKLAHIAPDDGLIDALGVSFNCDAGLFERASRQLSHVRKQGIRSPFVEEACRRYERCMHDFGLEAPEDIGKRRMLEIVADRLSSRLPAFRRQNSVLHVLPSLGPGSAQRQFVNLMAELRRRGRNEVIWALPLTFTTERERFYARRCAELDIRIVPPHRGSPTFSFGEHDDISRWISYLDRPVRKRFPPIVSAIHRCRPDTVHSWTTHCNAAGGFAALVAGVESIILGARCIPPKDEHYRYDVELYHAFLAARPQVRLVTNSIGAKAAFECRLHDAEQVASTVLETLATLCRSRDVSDRAIRFVTDRFDLRTTADRYLELYRSCNAVRMPATKDMVGSYESVA